MDPEVTPGWPEFHNFREQLPCYSLFLKPHILSAAILIAMYFIRLHQQIIIASP